MNKTLLLFNFIFSELFSYGTWNLLYGTWNLLNFEEGNVLICDRGNQDPFHRRWAQENPVAPSMAILGQRKMGKQSQTASSTKCYLNSSSIMVKIKEIVKVPVATWDVVTQMRCHNQEKEGIHFKVCYLILITQIKFSFFRISTLPVNTTCWLFSSFVGFCESKEIC